MEDSPEVIRQQMDETRTHLSEKLEALEQRVVNTVHEASASVNETIGSVKEAVHDTVQTVKESVNDTVDTVKDTFDVRRQVEARPWTMMAGATALGFLGGYLLMRSRSAPAERYAATGYHPLPSDNGAGVYDAPPPPPFTGMTPAAAAPAESGGILAMLSKTFEPELKELKGLAVGAVLGVVRDVVSDTIPPNMEGKVEEIIDGVTTRLGGKPIHGRILPKKPTANEPSSTGNNPAAFAERRGTQGFSSERAI
jgi:ElaB/YqjD/DUF883 family membrane-anchored ribosome-binding protein